MTKTTIEIEPTLLYQAKLKALEEKTSLKEVVEKSLTRYLNTQPKIAQEKVKIGGYKLGVKNTKITREDIYDYL